MKRTLLAAVAAALVLGGLAALLVWSITGEGRPPPPVTAPEPPPAVPPLLAPPEPTDPQVLRGRAEREEAQARYRALRDAFASARDGSGALDRLDPALRTLARAGSAQWKVACRGLNCRIDGSRGPEGWQAALRESVAVRSVADRIEVDPDGAEPSAYLLLAAPAAVEGKDALAEVERQLRASETARRCLAESPAKGTLQYDLELDSTGITYRTGGDLPWPVIQCVNVALTEAITTTPVPAEVRRSARSVALRTP